MVEWICIQPAYLAGLAQKVCWCPFTFSQSTMQLVCLSLNKPLKPSTQIAAVLFFCRSGAWHCSQPKSRKPDIMVGWMTLYLMYAQTYQYTATAWRDWFRYTYSIKVETVWLWLVAVVSHCYVFSMAWQTSKNIKVHFVSPSSPSWKHWLLRVFFVLLVKVKRKQDTFFF